MVDADGGTIHCVGLRGMGDEWAEGEVLFIDGAISFLGDVRPDTGILTVGSMEHRLKGRVLVFREGKGSTVGSYVVYNLKLEGNAPAAMVMLKADAIITMGCIAAGIPLVHKLRLEDFDRLRGASRVRVNSGLGRIETCSGTAGG